MTRLDQLREMIADSGDDCVLWPYALTHGYGAAWNGDRVVLTHIFACESMHGPRPGNAQAAHSCGMSRCVNPRHLRWASHAENAADRFTLGETTGRQSLTEADVIEIRRLAGSMSGAAIARQFGVSRGQVSKILRGAAWRHVTALAAPAA